MLDISDTKASAAYDGTIMNALKLEGKPIRSAAGVYSGYIINETLFERRLVMPANNTELVRSAELKEKGSAWRR
ncbi:MAG: hypothetical protein ACLUOI_26525 [Eisenbergiella sp.]